MKKLLVLIVIMTFNITVFADAGELYRPEGVQNYYNCIERVMESVGDFEAADENCESHLDGLNQQTVDAAKSTARNKHAGSDPADAGENLSVINGEIPGQPIDLPQRPVVYSVGSNGTPGIIDPPRGPWPVTRPIHITRDLDDGRGGVIGIAPVNGNEQGVGPGIEPVNQRPIHITRDMDDGRGIELMESGDPAGGAGDLLIIDGPRGFADETLDIGEGQGRVIRQLEPMFSVTTEECDRGGTVGLICSYDENQELVASTTSNLQSALAVLKNSGLEITPEGVLVAGGVVGTIALVARYARSFNPLGAFAIGLGVAPVAASDYCSMYSSDEGFEYFINELSNEEQIQELEACPALSQKIVDFGIQVQEAQ